MSSKTQNPMTRKTRLIILLICVVLFFIITPYIVLYSLGYRVDFKHIKITATGGIYVKAQPEATTISIDSKISNPSGFLSSYVFKQNLLPGPHLVTIQKPGYYNYQKNLEVTENEVTKLEHVVLIKQNIPFSTLENGVNNVYPSPDGKKLITATILANAITFKGTNLQTQEKTTILLPIRTQKITDITWSGDASQALVHINTTYYLLQPFLQIPKITALPYLYSAQQVSFNTQNNGQIFYIKNKNLYVNQNNIPLIKNIATYAINNSTATWLSQNGLLYTSDITNITPNAISEPFDIKTSSTYSLLINSDDLFLKQDDSLFWLNPKTKIIEPFYDQVGPTTFSPDGQKMLISSGHQLSLSFLKPAGQTITAPSNKILLNTFSDQINNVYWLNNDYVLAQVGDNIVISEIDVRGNINIVQLPQTVSLGDGTSITIQDPQISFSQEDKKLYILTQGNLLSSERLIP